MDELSFRRIRETLQLVKETDARSRVLFTLVRNLTVEIQGLRAENQTLLRALRSILELPPENPHHAKAILKDTQVRASHAYDKPK